MESSRRQYVAARAAVVSAISQCKREYYKNQIASCDRNQERLFKVMERRSDPMLSHFLSDADLAFSFLYSRRIYKDLPVQLDLFIQCDRAGYA